MNCSRLAILVLVLALGFARASAAQDAERNTMTLLSVLHLFC